MCQAQATPIFTEHQTVESRDEPFVSSKISNYVPSSVECGCDVASDAELVVDIFSNFPSSSAANVKKGSDYTNKQVSEDAELESIPLKNDLTSLLMGLSISLRVDCDSYPGDIVIASA